MPAPPWTRAYLVQEWQLRDVAAAITRRFEIARSGTDTQARARWYGALLAARWLLGDSPTHPLTFVDEQVRADRVSRVYYDALRIKPETADGGAYLQGVLRLVGWANGYELHADLPDRLGLDEEKYTPRSVWPV